MMHRGNRSVLSSVGEFQRIRLEAYLGIQQTSKRESVVTMLLAKCRYLFFQSVSSWMFASVSDTLLEVLLVMVGNSYPYCLTFHDGGLCHIETNPFALKINGLVSV